MQKKIKTPTGSTLNCTSLLKSSVVNVPSNDVTNNLKGKERKSAQKLLNY